MELFSHMSTEALQAIDETREEMGKNDVKEIMPESKKPAAEEIIVTPVPTKEDSNKQTDKMEDNDSAIGTCSMKSHNAVELPLPPRTISPTKPVEISRSFTVCGYHPTDADMKRRHEARHPSLQPSQFTQECVKNHMPFVAEPREVKKMNVFERLSAPAPISYKPTARQRTRARLSLSLNLSNDKKEMLAFGQRKEPGTRRDSLRSAFPTVLRSLKRESNTKPVVLKEASKTTTTNSAKTHNTEPGHPTLNKSYAHNTEPGYPTLNKSYAKLKIGNRKPSSNEENVSEKNITPPVQGKPLHTSRQFQITPMGYDSRYMALKYDQPLYADNEFDECEILEQSKVKCQQWLAHQMTILTSS